ncbi:hypothetical protein GCM10010458_11240 [Microbacterium luteolum]
MQRIVQALRGEESGADAVYSPLADIFRQLHPADAVLPELHAAGQPTEAGEEQLWIEHPSTMPGPAVRDRRQGARWRKPGE